MAVAEFLFSVLASVVASVLIILLIDRQKKPKLRMVVGSSHSLPDEDPLGRPATKWLSWLYSRDPAVMCQAWLTFYHGHPSPDYRHVYDREMVGRWADSPPPDIRTVETPDGIKALLHNATTSIDIPAGGRTLLDVAVRLNSEEDCYGYNNQSHIYPDLKNSDWKLEKGAYLVKARVRTGGRDFLGVFRIVNDVQYNDFRLEKMDDKLAGKLVGPI